MEAISVVALWSGDPFAGLVVFGSGAPLICAVFAALIGTILAVLRESGGGTDAAGLTREDRPGNERHVTSSAASAPR